MAYMFYEFCLLFLSGNSSHPFGRSQTGPMPEGDAGDSALLGVQQMLSLLRTHVSKSKHTHGHVHSRLNRVSLLLLNFKF